MSKKTQRESNTKLIERTSRPKKYKVIMINDDYTPMHFVTMVLEQIFNKSPAEASRVMLSVHRQGSGIAGVYSKEVAETKRDRTIQEARSNGYPLMLHTEPEE